MNQGDSTAAGHGLRQQDLLLCYAVKEEVGSRAKASRARILVTGMGPRNAQSAIMSALTEKPSLVITAGFAGGLNPVLETGQVVFSTDPNLGLEEVLTRLGASPARFRNVREVMTRAEEKRLLYGLTAADAVEMESSQIRGACQRQGVPSATIRVVLDTAREDLPIDFNAVLTPRHTINYGKLLWLILRKPGTIGGLRKLQRQSRFAAERLDEVLGGILAQFS